jgi:outer membrane biogenesis lipoprotein LolB
MRHQTARAGFVLLVAPLLLSACASRGNEAANASGPSAAQAMTAANESKSTADNALSTAQKALQMAQKAENDAQAASQKSDQMYNRSLRK